jgi:hypothetical protein
MQRRNQNLHRTDPGVKKNERHPWNPSDGDESGGKVCSNFGYSRTIIPAQSRIEKK